MRFDVENHYVLPAEAMGIECPQDPCGSLATHTDTIFAEFRGRVLLQ